jgi:hypothetical protein
LTLRWTYGTSSYSELLSGLSDGSFRLAQHVTGLGDASVWTTTRGGDPGDPVPLPPSVWLFGMGLIGAAGDRLRKRRR